MCAVINVSVSDQNYNKQHVISALKIQQGNGNFTFSVAVSSSIDTLS